MKNAWERALGMENWFTTEGMRLFFSPIRGPSVSVLSDQAERGLLEGKDCPGPAACTEGGAEWVLGQYLLM